MDQQLIFKNLKQDDQDMLERVLQKGTSNVSHQIHRHIIYYMSSVSISTSYVSLSKDKQYMIQKVYVIRMICMYEPIISSLLDRKISPPLAP